MPLSIFDASRQIAGKENANKLNDTNRNSGSAQTDCVRPNIVPEGCGTSHIETCRCGGIAFESAQCSGNISTTTDRN